MNCTKEYAQEIVDKFWKREWNKIKSIPLPDTRENEISDKHLVSEFTSLCNRQLSNKTRSDLIHKFHPSIMRANRGKNLSPVEFWKLIQDDPEEFKKFYLNRLLRSDWFNEKNGQNRHFLDEGFVPNFIYAIGCTTGHFAEAPSYFKPACAKNILEAYAPEVETVIDCFSGYSGRMLGTLAAGKKYIGSDLNDITISESKNVLNWIETTFPELRGKATLEIKDAFTSSGKADVFLSCPPYLKNGYPIEVWESSAGKVVCMKTADDIVEYVLKNYDCQKYIFVFNDDTTKYTDYIKENLENVNYIGARQGKLTSASRNYEPVFVFTREDRDKIIKELD